MSEIYIPFVIFSYFRLRFSFVIILFSNTSSIFMSLRDMTFLHWLKCFFDAAERTFIYFGFFMRWFFDMIYRRLIAQLFNYARGCRLAFSIEIELSHDISSFDLLYSAIERLYIFIFIMSLIYNKYYFHIIYFTAHSSLSRPISSYSP